MQKQVEQLDCRDSIFPVIDNAVNSIDIVIANLHDFETSRVLQKYGFNIHCLLNDLNACKEDVTQLQNSQQRCLDAFDKYTEIKRSLGIMQYLDTIIEQIAQCIEQGNCDLLIPLVYNINETHTIGQKEELANILNKYRENHLAMLNAAQETEEEKFIAKRNTEDCFDYFIRGLNIY